MNLAMFAASTTLGPLVKMILGLAIIGFLLWLIVTYIPMPDIFKKVIMVIVAIVVIIFVCQYFGIF